MPIGRWTLPAILLAAFAIRVLPLALPFEFSGPDTASYLDPAIRLAAGQGLTLPDGSPAIGRPPGYAAFLAALFLLAGGPALGLVQAAQAALGALCAWCVHRTLAREGEPVALLGAGLVALDPVSAGQSPFILREALLQGLVALVVALLLGRGRWRHPLAGLALVGLALTHQLYVLLGPFLALADLLAARTRRARLLRLARWTATGVLVALAVHLWARRNEVALERAGLPPRYALTLADNAVPARELWLSATYDTWWLSGDFATGFQANAWREERALMDRLGLEGTKAEMYRRTAELWREHPLRTLARNLRLNAWYWLEIPGAVRLAEHPRLQVVRWALLPWHWVRLTCAAAGLVWLWRSGRWRLHAPVVGVVAFFLVAPAPLYPVPRYLGPAIPVLCLLAAHGLAASLRRRGARA